jgi:hypothetical protein
MNDAKIKPKGISAGGTVVRASIAGVHMKTNVYWKQTAVIRRRCIANVQAQMRT